MARRLTVEELPRLAEILQNHLPESCKVYGTLMSTIQGKMPMEFWVDDWPGVKAVLVKAYMQDMYVCGVFHTDQNAMLDLLNTPGVVDWKIATMFGGWPYGDLSIFVDVAKRHNCDVNTSTLEIADVYCVAKDCIRTVDPPADVTLGCLSLEHAELVRNAWEYGGTTTSFIEKHIELFPSVCLCDKTGEPVAFELMMFNGSMGILFVKPEHRRKGYARYLTSVLARKIHAGGQQPYVFITRDNTPSRRLHESVGFKQLSSPPITWIKAVPKSCGGTCTSTKREDKKYCCI